MDKIYNHLEVEQKWQDLWEKKGYFSPKIDLGKKPFTIILPLPNANDPLHMGHALFTIQDILIRYHRMQQTPTLWLPGGDHAGIETQFVFEKKLAKEGKSRFDFERDTLFQMIAEFVDKNKDINRNQMKKLGFSLDWNRYHFSLEKKILDRAMDTFRKLYREGLVYKAQRLVNYCTFCGTAFSDLEVEHIEKDESLYFLDYGSIQIATTRPETIFADEAVAVNPKDKRYKKLIGKKVTVPLVNKNIPIISDENIDMNFGTGALKVTPGHDYLDFEIGVKNKLPITTCIDISGKMVKVPEPLAGLYPKQGRVKTVELLKQAGNLVKTIPHRHTIGVCYRCKNTIEPLPFPQWYIKTKSLADPAIKAVETGKTKIFPQRFKKLYFDWMRNIKDWNISRQIVWGPRIPIWYCLECSLKSNANIFISFLGKPTKNSQKKSLISDNYSKLKSSHTIDEILKGLQSLRAPIDSVYSLNPEKCDKCTKGGFLIQETDTFDTWFLSGQWPVNTLKDKKGDFDYFYPTSLLDTLWDILFFWVGRMMMLGIYLTNEVPFKVIHLHSRVTDKFGKKMSKSKGNVINPITMSEKYGTDALRIALIFGTAPASNIVVSEDKIIAMRNFANKLWNIGRFIEININSYRNRNRNTNFYNEFINKSNLSDNNKKIISLYEALVKEVTKNITHYRFGQATVILYEFIWHTLADKYIESTKDKLRKYDTETLSVLTYVFINCLKLLHPFMPFITEEINNHLILKNNNPLIISSWPKS